jgi:hypothetical protein
MKVSEGFVGQQHLEHDLDSIGAPQSATSLCGIEQAIPPPTGRRI